MVIVLAVADGNYTFCLRNDPRDGRRYCPLALRCPFLGAYALRICCFVFHILLHVCVPQAVHRSILQRAHVSRNRRHPEKRLGDRATRRVHALEIRGDQGLFRNLSASPRHYAARNDSRRGGHPCVIRHRAGTVESAGAILQRSSAGNGLGSGRGLC